MLQGSCRFQVHVRPEAGEPDGFIAQVFQAGKQGAWCPQLVHAFRMFKDSYGGCGFIKSSKTWSFRAADRIEDLRAAVEWSGADAELVVNQAFYDRPGPHNTQQSLSQPNPAPSHRGAQVVASMHPQSQQSQSSYSSDAACGTAPAGLQQHAPSSYPSQELLGSPHGGFSSPRSMRTHSQGLHGSPWDRTPQAPHHQTSTANSTAGPARHLSPPQHPSWPEDDHDPEALNAVDPAAFSRLGSRQPVQQVAYGRSPDGHFSQQQQQQQGSAASQPPSRLGYSASQVMHSPDFEHQPAGSQSHAGLQDQPGHGCSISSGAPISDLPHTLQKTSLLAGGQQLPGSPAVGFGDPTRQAAACSPGSSTATSSELQTQVLYTSQGPRVVRSPAKRKREGTASCSQQFSQFSRASPGQPCLQPHGGAVGKPDMDIGSQLSQPPSTPSQVPMRARGDQTRLRDSLLGGSQPKEGQPNATLHDALPHSRPLQQQPWPSSCQPSSSQQSARASPAVRQRGMQLPHEASQWPHSTGSRHHQSRSAPKHNSPICFSADAARQLS